MQYIEYPPTSGLAKHLETIWFISEEGHTPAKSTPFDRVLPDGCIEWIFHLGAPFQRSFSRGWELQGRSFVVGELTRFILLQATGPTATMGIRFRPGGAYRFIKAPLNLLTNETVPTEDVWGPEGKYLEDAVLNTSSDAERMMLVQTFLLERHHTTSSRPRFDAAVGQIIGSRGQTRVDQLADRIGWSPRQLEREFRASAGLSPKALARIIRFQHLLKLVGEDKLRDWVSLALASGYADQPHMVREFREFCGQSPTQRQATAVGELSRHLVSPHRLAALLGKPDISTLPV
jgi:AraC-like DNA-binding protein